jgi:hypothetical protein
MAEEEYIYDLYASAIDLLNEMSIRSMPTEHWSNMLKGAYDAKDVGAFNVVIKHLQQRLAAHPVGPAAAVPSPPVHDVPAPAPRAKLPANSAPPVDLVIRPPPPKRRRRGARSVAPCSHGSNGEQQEAFLEIFTKFAFEYGREQFQRTGNVHLISNDMIFAAFIQSDPSYTEEPPPFFIPKKLYLLLSS